MMEEVKPFFNYLCFKETRKFTLSSFFYLKGKGKLFNFQSQNLYVLILVVDFKINFEKKDDLTEKSTR